MVNDLITTRESNRKKVFTKLDEEFKLPSPSGTALEVLRLCNNETSSLHEIAEIIQTDPALSAEIIKSLPKCVRAKKRSLNCFMMFSPPLKSTVWKSPILPTCLPRSWKAGIAMANCWRSPLASVIVIERRIISHYCIRYRKHQKTLCHSVVVWLTLFIPCLRVA